MKAVIVAAGLSSRLYPLTAKLPKPLLRVSSDGLTLLERSVRLLTDVGIEEIWVVVGFNQDKIRDCLGDGVRYLTNPFYEQTNNMTSLWLAIPHLGDEDFIYMHGDVIYDSALLDRLIPGNTRAGIDLLVDFGEVDEEAMKVRVVDGRFVESSKAIPLSEAAGEWTGLARITAPASNALYSSIEQALAEGRFQDYDTSALTHLARQGLEFGLLPTDGLPWCEIDTPADLDCARSLFQEK